MKLIDGEIVRVVRLTDSGVVFDKDFLKIEGENKFREGYFYKVDYWPGKHLMFKCIDDDSKSLVIEKGC